ncbi:YHYH domain-containing protein, partial [Klebsiella pneumoniae]|uniref:YHYH domain-containing protein n=1 Tax=Klebsiella pneumoniae TaxID=573 RepID=UPI00272F5C25
KQRGSCLLDEGNWPYSARRERSHEYKNMSMEQALMKLSALLIADLISISSDAAFAHSGGTDSKGCHRNHKTNDYHCH